MADTRKNPHQMQRLFIALWPDSATRAAMHALGLTAVREGVGLERVKLTAVANLHMTMKFLGKVASASVDDVVSAVAALAVGIEPFELTMRELIVLQSLRRPNVLALATDEPPRLIALATQLDHACASLGFEREQRPFRAHVTLGRFKHGHRRGRGGGSPIQLPHITRPALDWRIERVVLVRSRLQLEGPRYDVVAEAALGKRNGDGAGGVG